VSCRGECMSEAKNAGTDNGKVKGVGHGAYQGREKVLTLV
jgi:hypothetical protein